MIVQIKQHFRLNFHVIIMSKMNWGPPLCLYSTSKVAHLVILDYWLRAKRLCAEKTKQSHLFFLLCDFLHLVDLD